MSSNPRSYRYSCTSLHRLTVLLFGDRRRSADVFSLYAVFILLLAVPLFFSALCGSAALEGTVSSSSDASAVPKVYNVVSAAEVATEIAFTATATTAETASVPQPKATSPKAEEAAVGEPEEELSVGGVQLDVPANIRLDRITLDVKAARPLEYATISSLFGYRLNPVTEKYTFHSGYDLAAPSGAVIRAILSGRVSVATFDNGYGNYVVIDHGSGIQTLYAHCSKLKCSAGDEIKQGEEIALVGSTGNSTGPHLHIELRKDGQRYDPEWVLGGMYD